MKIALVTTLPGLIEGERLKEEITKLGYEFELKDLSNFGYTIDETALNIEGLEDLNSDLVIVRGIFNSLNTICTVVESLRERGIKVFDNNLTDLKYSIDKVTDLVKLSLAGIEIPKTYYSRDFAKYSELAQKNGFPLIIKSTRTGKGASVFKVESQEELQEFIQKVEAEGKEAKNYLLQEFIPYEYDLRVLIIGEKLFAMRRIPQEGEFRANFSLGGSVELFNLDSEGQELAKKALAAVGMSVGGVDILITKDNKRSILEVNHTAGWVGMEKATGENITKIYLDHALNAAK